MVTVSMLLFWIPVCIGIISFFYFTKHSRKARILVLSFFTHSVFHSKNNTTYLLSSLVNTVFVYNRVIFVYNFFYFCLTIFFLKY